MTRPDIYRHLVQAILSDQLSDATAFIKEWRTALENNPWMVKIDGLVRVVAQAYAEELQRLIKGEAGSKEWTQILEQVNLLRAATFDQFLKLQPQLKSSQTSLPISGPGPKSIADKTYQFLVDAAYQFGSSLGELRKDFPADVQIVAGALSLL